MQAEVDSIPAGRERQLYEALIARDPSYDGSVYYGITSTGIFCRPVCPARKPRFENVRYFDSVQAAMSAGFRACKVCRPADAPEDVPPRYRALVQVALSPNRKRIRDADLRADGLEPEAVRRFFKRRYGMTFHAFARGARLANAFDAIRCGTAVAAASFDSGYRSLSGFNYAAHSAAGRSPVDAARLGVIWITRFETRLGTMAAGEYMGKLCLLEFADRRAMEKEIHDLERIYKVASKPGRVPLHDAVEAQLAEYFAGTRRAFELPLDMRGSDFQRAVWNALIDIPYGQTRSYRDQAVAIGKPDAVRAVARANGANRIAVVVPCHRVIGADGSLTGYGGGLQRKQALLELEGARLI